MALISALSWVFTISGDAEEKSIENILPPFTIVMTTDTVVCVGGNISLAPVITGGTAPFSFLWIGPNGYTSTDSNIVITNISSLEEGIYGVEITDSSTPVEINKANTEVKVIELKLDAAASTLNCAGDNNGIIKLNVEGGDAPYTYLWSDGQTTEIPTGLAAGIYTVTVSDNTVCTATISAEVIEPLALSVSGVQKDVICNGGDNGEIDITVTGGTPVISYNWSNGELVEDISGLSAGTYTVTITDLNDCSTTNTFIIAESTPIVLSISNQVDVDCNGNATGELTTSISGGAGGETYLWSDGQITNPAVALVAGTYTLTVTDANDCTATISATILEPEEIKATISSQTHVSCNGNSTGEATASGTGGQVAYSYLWSDGQSTATASNLPSGTYTVTITDNNNCTATAEANIIEPPVLAIDDFDIKHNLCFGNSTGAIRVLVIGGNPAYDYDWSDGQDTPIASSLVAGDYTVTVTDANNCTVTASYTITEPTELTLTTTHVDLKCNGDSDATITATPLGGTPTYNYVWSNGGSTATISSLSVGTYTVTVTDGNNCTVTETVSITEPLTLTLGLTPTHIICNGDDDGSITATVSGGTPSYVYTWSNGGSTATINSLAVGNYTVTVTDNNNCTIIEETIITEPTPFVVVVDNFNDINCDGDTNGSIDITVSGGTPSYSYLWSNGNTSEDLNGIGGGTYTVTITDGNNCTTTTSVVLTNPSAMSLSGNVTDVNCNGGSDGLILDINVTGGTPGYTYTWDDWELGGIYAFEGSTDDLSSNNHDLITKNAAGTFQYSDDSVERDSSFDFDGNTRLRYDDGAGYFEDAFTEKTVAMWIKPSDLVGIELLYEEGDNNDGMAMRLEGNTITAEADRQGHAHIQSGPVTIPNDGAWHHVALVFDNGTLTIYLDGVAGTPVSSTFTSLQNHSSAGGLGGRWGNTAYEDGLGGFYEGLMDDVRYYNNALSDEDINDIMVNDGNRNDLTADDYIVTVTDANGCQITQTFTIQEPSRIDITSSATQVLCYDGDNGSIDITIIGGISPYNYLWSNGATTKDINNLVAGDYTVTVTDNHSCTMEFIETITEPDSINLNIISTVNVRCNGENTGSINLGVSGGTSPYSYLWDNGAGTNQDPSNLTAGFYTVTVTDNNTCTATISVEIKERPPMILTMSSTDAGCIGDATGSASVDVSGGRPNYDYSWSTGSTNDEIADLAAGTYTVTITDRNDCTATASITIDEPTDIDIQGTISNVSCNGGNDGSLLDLDVTGGTPEYTYIWDDMETEAYWTFEGTTDDISGNDHDLIAYQGNIDYDGDAIERDSAFDFDGGTQMQYSDPGTFLTIPITTRTISLWVKPDDATAGRQTLFSMGNGIDGIAIRLNNGIIEAGVVKNGNAIAILNTPYPSGSAYHHIVLVYDNGDIKLFLDNVEVDSASTGFGTLNIPSAVWGGLGGNLGWHAFTINDFTVGQIATMIWLGLFPPQDYYNGLMDNVSYHNIALTDEQINDLHENNGDRTGLEAGIYTVTVFDSNGCSKTVDFEVVEPEELDITGTASNVLCDGDESGSINITVTGGVPSYSYLWSNGATTQNISSLGEGTYTVTVTDDNDCTITFEEEIISPALLNISTTSSANYGGFSVSCTGATDGGITTNGTGGTPSFTYSWNTGATTADLANVGAGTYIVTITDVYNCTATSSIILTEPPSITLSATPVVQYNGEHISCTDEEDGDIITTISGGSGIYTYSWSNGDNTQDLNDIEAGTYTVTVTDQFNCTTIASATLTEPSVISTAISLGTNFNGFAVSCPGGTDGVLNSTSNGGTTAYSYLWNTGATTSTIMGIGSGTFMLTVTDANGCTAADTLILSAPSDIDFDVTSSPLSDCGADDGGIGVTATGGIGMYEYKINAGAWQTSPNFYGLAPGTYDVFVKSANGNCQVGPKTVVIGIPSAPVINNIIMVNPTTTTSTDGSVLVNATGNGTLIEYRIVGVTGWQNSSTFNGLSEGVYTVDIKYYDQTCMSSQTIQLIAGAGVVGSGEETDYCSDDINGVQLTETYYIPAPEDQILQSLRSIFSTTAPLFCSTSTPNPVDPVQSYVVIGAVEDGIIVYYDHWEDGYEPNLTFPIQATTEIWGDGDPSNGIPPGFTTDILNAADRIILDNAVVTSTRATVIDFDGSDKVAARGNIAMTRLAWATGTGTLLAGALEVYPSEVWGTKYKIPVGENTDVNSMFQYTGAVIMAENDNTTVDIDADGNGTFETLVTLDEGESYLINGNLNSGGTINSSENIQVHLLTGDECSTYESRFFTLKPIDQWSDGYYSPVSTSTTAPTYVHLYNPNNTSLNIQWETSGGSQIPFTIPAGGTAWREIPDGSGAHFHTNNENYFYAIATIDSESNSSTTGNSANDWGYALIPESQLTSQITLVSFAPGHDPTLDDCSAGGIVPQTGWTVHNVSSQETVSEFAPASNAFDGNPTTYWHSQYSGGSPPSHPHELQIDMGADFDINEFRYLPNSNLVTNNYINTTNVTISSTSASTVVSNINVPTGGTITDVNIANLDIKHTYIDDLIVTLTSPNGTVVTLLNRPCGNEDNINMGLDDEGTNGFPCPPTNGNSYQPTGSLSDFDGENSTGTWMLSIRDVFGPEDGGFLDDWNLEITTGTVENGTIADYEIYLSSDGTNWGSVVSLGTWANDITEKVVSFPEQNARYIRLVANSEVNGNIWASAAEINVSKCISSVTENAAPVWITADFPSGSSGSGNITICVDHDGDGGSFTDPNGVPFDEQFVITALQRLKIYDDNDTDQSGMRIWVCDGSDAIIAGAWGQDPATASGGEPAIDLGVGLPNGIPLSTSKCVDLSKDYNLNGKFDECDEIFYTVIVENNGALPLSPGSVNIADTIPSDLTYIPNTTMTRQGGVDNLIADDGGASTPFPLDEGGIFYDTVILPGDSVIITFEASINDLSGSTIINNTAFITNSSVELTPEVSFPAEEPVSPQIDGFPNDITVSCSEVPDTLPINEPNCTFSNVEYPSEQTAGTQTMGGQVLSSNGVTVTYNIISNSILTDFRITDNMYPRDASQNSPCGASTKAIDYSQLVEESNPSYGSGSNSKITIDFSQEVENLSFNLSDFDEGDYFVDGVMVQIFDVSGTEIEYSCGHFTMGNLVRQIDENKFQSSDNFDGFIPLANTNAEGDIMFHFYELGVKRVEITLTNNWDVNSSSGTSSTTFSIYNSANPDATHGIGIGQMCYCIPGTNEGSIFVANDCVNNTTVDYTETITDGGCEHDYIMERTWTITDHCGNETTHTQVITVEDNSGPLLEGIPADITVSPADVPEPPCAGAEENLALNKTATQSSTGSSGVASRAVDGNIDGTFSSGSVTHTNNQANAWWEVDLGAIENIGLIELWNRTDCCEDRLSDFYVFVSDVPFTSTNITTTINQAGVFSYYEPGTALKTTSVVTNRSGRYIRIQLAGTNVLSLAEVRVIPETCVRASDNCSYATIDFAQDTISTSCTHTIRRIWTATDDCDQVATDTQFIYLDASTSNSITINSDYNGEDISCNDGSNGIVEVSTIVDFGPFTYNWSNGASTAVVSGLSAGTYTVTVTDRFGCMTPASITVTEPSPITINTDIVSDYNGNDISCVGADDASALANASGGTGTLSYLWSTGATTPNIFSLSAGAYTVTVTDINNCTATAEVILEDPEPIDITTTNETNYNGFNVSCNGSSDASISATATSGVAISTYEWSEGTTGQVVIGVSAGTYTVTVTDINECTGTEILVVNEPTILSGSATIDSDFNGEHVSCTGVADGEAHVTPTGGVSPYTYLWSEGTTTSTISNIGSGTYTVTITDINNCTSTTTITLIDPDPLTLDITTTNITCNGDGDGSIAVVPDGGVGSYTILWAGGITDFTRTNLSAGNYFATVTDGNGCTTEITEIITEAGTLSGSALATPVTCFGEGDGALDITVTGGASPFTYNWSNSETTKDISGLSGGVYTVTITDVNLCETIVTETVIENVTLTGSLDSTNISCFGEVDGSIDLTIIGGTSPYTYSWSNGATTEDISGLTENIYTVTITDAHLCETTATASIVEPDSLDVTYIFTEPLCFGDVTANIDLTVTGGTTGYTYNWSNGSSTEDLTNVAGAIYTVTVTDTRSCQKIITIDARGPGDLTASVNIDSDINGYGISCNGTSDGELRATVGGGTAPFSYLWSDPLNQTTQTITGLPVGTYTVTVTDANNCTVTSSATLTEPSISLTVSTASSNNVSCNGGNNGTINITPSGGVSPYSYDWSNSATTEDLTGLPTGTYTVTVTDENNCSVTLTESITEPSLLTVNAGADQTVCGNTDTDLTVVVTGGTTAYGYAWSNGGTTASITVNIASTTTYTVTITDANSCTITDEVIINIIGCTEDCTNGIDDDLDGLVDCDDTDCIPLANNSSLNTCDNSNNSGQGTFVLHDANSMVSSESGVIISYHATFADAQNGINLLVSPYSTSDATVYVRVERVSTGCFATADITLDVGTKCPENCGNGIDEDGDGLIDCDDPDCPCCKASAPTLNGLNKKDP